MGLLDSLFNFGATAATNRANQRIQDSINATNTANVNATNQANREIAEATNAANIQMNEANNAANRELAELQNDWNLQQKKKQKGLDCDRLELGQPVTDKDQYVTQIDWQGEHFARMKHCHQ